MLVLYKNSQKHANTTYFLTKNAKNTIF